MIDVVEGKRLPIKMWLPKGEIEEGCLEQYLNLSGLPFAFKHVVANADSHQGYGMPIGGVLATRHVVIPNAVGVDIGCGMCAIRTSIRVDEVKKNHLLAILGGSKEHPGGIRAKVPVGMKHHKKQQNFRSVPNPDQYDLPIDSVVGREAQQRALYQVGTLGGGNHFIEVQAGDDGFMWAMIHSGSRNVGFQVARHYNNLAKELNDRWFSSVPANQGLAFLPLDTEEGQNYVGEMNYCVDFALANRTLMMQRVEEAIAEVFPEVEFQPMINIPHNYVVMEHHFDKNVMVHRKGATRAYEGETGIIPGSQGTHSYIVRGKGNPESFKSCSHGAGRVMSRTKACNELDLGEQQALLDDQDIIHGIRNAKDLDEAPGAYKDIDQVMENQRDLVEIVTKLRPLAVVKG